MNRNDFDNDLFISYAHIDNLCFPGRDSGWIDLLHERLEVRLAQLLGGSPRIWRDKKLKGFEVFSETIVIQLSRSAIFLSIVSPRYIKSDSCRSEIDSYFGNEEKCVQLGDKRRAFRVVKTPVPLAEQPQELRDLLSYDFYEVDKSGRVYEFDHEITSQGEKDKRYWNKFEDLAWDLHLLIKYLEAPDPPVTRSGATIYLAETTSDLIDERDKVRRELMQHGHVVLPDKSLPLNAAGLQNDVRSYLERSQLSVHLIGELYGIIPENEVNRSVVRLQQELAIERGDNAQFSRLIWMPPGLHPKDERQQRFVNELQNSFSSQNGSELLQVELEELKTIIQSKLTQKPKVQVDPVEERATRIYLICDQRDVEAVMPIYGYLCSQGYEVILPLSEGTDAEFVEDHKDNLLISDALLIFQGAASEGWLRMKLRELLKLRGSGRTTPLLGKAVYLSVPKSPLKENFQTREADVIKNFGKFNPDLLTPFLEQLSNMQGGSK